MNLVWAWSSAWLPLLPKKLMTCTNNKRWIRANFDLPAIYLPWLRKHEGSGMRLAPRTLVPVDVRAPGAAWLPWELMAGTPASHGRHTLDGRHGDTCAKTKSTTRFSAIGANLILLKNKYVRSVTYYQLLNFRKTIYKWIFHIYINLCFRKYLVDIYNVNE